MQLIEQGVELFQSALQALADVTQTVTAFLVVDVLGYVSTVADSLLQTAF